MNTLKDVAEDLQRGVVWVPDCVLRRHELEPAQLLEPRRREAALATLEEIEAGDDALRPGRSPKVSHAALATMLRQAAVAVGDGLALARLLEAPTLAPRSRTAPGVGRGCG